jgi:transposase-like protein
MLKAIHAQESKAASREKAEQVITSLAEIKLKKAAKKIKDGIEETLRYTGFPYEHWFKIKKYMSMKQLKFVSAA